MNRDEVIELAKKAGWSGLYMTLAKPNGKPDWSPYEETLNVPVTIEQVERFAALVEERCIQRMYDNTDNMHDEQAMTMKAIFSDAIRGKAY